jgi:hypothetical protein
MDWETILWLWINERMTNSKISVLIWFRDWRIDEPVLGLISSSFFARSPQKPIPLHQRA